MRRRNASGKHVLFAAIAIGAGIPGVAARADTLNDVQGKIESLQRSVHELEQQQPIRRRACVQPRE